MAHLDVPQALRRTYVRLAVPAAVAVAAVWAARRLRPEPLAGPEVAAVVGPGVFILAAVFSLALPLWHRAGFVHRVRGRAKVEPEEFLRFERIQMGLVMTSVYVASAGYLVDITRFHFAGAFLCALYGAYYYFPSQRRVDHERRIFRVRGSEA